MALFPNASTYVMAGLEPPGNIPPLPSLNKATLGRTERGMEVALGNLMKLSYFITKNMSNQLRPGPVYGTLPVIYIFLARSGATIDETTFVSVDSAGNEIPGDPNQKSAAKGVKIVFSLDGGPKKTLYYFSTDLANGGVKNSGFLAFCEKLGTNGADAFVKSASYLLHGDAFSTTRSFLLDHRRRRSCRTTPASRCASSTAPSGSRSRSAITPGRSRCSRTIISRSSPSSTTRAIRSRSTSASATDSG